MPFPTSTRAVDSDASTRLRRNRIASALIIVAVVLVIGWTWWSSPARNVDRSQSAATASTMGQSPVAGDPAAMPRALNPVWSTATSSSTDSHLTSPTPLVLGTSLIVAEDSGVRAVSLHDGTERWHYRRDIPLCALSGSDGLVYATFRGPAGCGETVALKPETGEYAATRRSISSDSPIAVRSNSYAGVYNSDFLELWRTDLVRVVEYGKIPATPEPDLQPHADCSIVSAQTRVELLAVINNCNGRARLVMQDANPKESRKPEVKSDIDLGPMTSDMQLVAIGQKSAAVLSDNRVRVFREDGTQLSDTALQDTALRPAQSDATSQKPTSDEPRAAFTADLPHQMTWWSPRGLMGFRPSTLESAFEFPEAVGTPAPWGEHILMPVADGIAVINSETREIIGTLPLPDGMGFAGSNASVPVRLAVVGDTLLVQHDAAIDAFAIEA
ncbi:MAG: hypothetical protein Q4E11_09375 [Corynebacterium sp.]|uniref:Rv3212 family protein n=1 Tax=Corynebacterium sp. TaxID=1720 RepID=UPI0026DB2284|nr:hypothetical protein [Corynebacterium sp.]MDO5030770.1 hypothetical protein [Corynebacterium sp.]